MTEYDLLAALKDMIRIVEAVRYSAGLGKGQIERVQRAKKVVDQFEGNT